MAALHKALLAGIHAKIGEPFKRLDPTRPDFDSWRREYRRGHEEERARALAEVDGLFAGFRFLEKIETKQDLNSTFSHADTASAASHPDEPLGRSHVSSPEALHNSSIDHEGAHDASSPQPLHKSSSASTPSGLADTSLPASLIEEPGRSHWALLKTVKEASDAHHQEFQGVECEAGTAPLVLRLKQQFDTPKKLRERAGQVHRDILSRDDAEPTTLGDVFAFSFLSYVVCRQLVQRGRLVEANILCGLRHWLDAIVDLEERAAFAWLARKLWPQQAHYLSPSEPPDAPPEHYMLNASSTFMPRLVRLSPDLSAGNDQDSNGYHPFQYQPQTVDPAALHGTNVHLPHTDHFSPHTLGIFDPKPSDSLFADFVYLDSGPVSVGYEGLDPAAGHQESLQNTVIFAVLQRFIKELGDLPYLLSGRGMTVCDPRSGLGQGKFSKAIAAGFFHPRARTSCPRSFRALLSITKRWVDLGYLRSTGAVETCLIDLGRVSTKPFLQ